MFKQSKSKLISIFVLLLIAAAVYFLFVHTSYSGECDFSANGKDYELKLKRAETRKANGGIYYRLDYAGKNSTVRIRFKLQEESGQVHIQMDNPTIILSEGSYTLSRSIRNSDYYQLDCDNADGYLHVQSSMCRTSSAQSAPQSSERSCITMMTAHGSW